MFVESEQDIPGSDLPDGNGAEIRKKDGALGRQAVHAAVLTSPVGVHAPVEAYVWAVIAGEDRAGVIVEVLRHSERRVPSLFRIGLQVETLEPVRRVLFRATATEHRERALHSPGYTRARR
jgi:hypothetical protein